MTYRRKLIEVALPPLHPALWWACRSLATCRTVLYA